MILLDPPAWPAHGTMWSHLVSDRSLSELHTFASGLGISRRAFDLDHYDIPADSRTEALTAGATAVGAGELTRRLIASGLRVRGRDRAVLKGLRRRWLTQRPDDYVTVDDLLVRWREPHRVYHGPAHLAQTLAALDELAASVDQAPGRLTGTEASPGDKFAREDLVAAELALWFHDAVHAGTSPDDEEASAALVLAVLGDARVAELVRMTADHRPSAADRAAALVADADLAILGADPPRYNEYARQIRAEYAHVPPEEFHAGRRAVLTRLLTLPSLYATAYGRAYWAARADHNLRRELAALSG